MTRASYVESIADYGAALRFQPEFSQAWYHRGECHHEIAAYPLAIADFTSVISLRPELALRFGVHPAQVNQWKHQLEKTARRVFSGEEVERKPSPREEELVAALERMQGELDWLKKKVTR